MKERKKTRFSGPISHYINTYVSLIDLLSSPFGYVNRSIHDSTRLYSLQCFTFAERKSCAHPRSTNTMVKVLATSQKQQRKPRVGSAGQRAKLAKKKVYAAAKRKAAALKKKELNAHRLMIKKEKLRRKRMVEKEKKAIKKEKQKSKLKQKKLKEKEKQLKKKAKEQLKKQKLKVKDDARKSRLRLKKKKERDRQKELERERASWARLKVPEMNKFILETTDKSAVGDKHQKVLEVMDLVANQKVSVKNMKLISRSVKLKGAFKSLSKAQLAVKLSNVEYVRSTRKPPRSPGSKPKTDGLGPEIEVDALSSASGFHSSIVDDVHNLGDMDGEGDIFSTGFV